MEYLKNVTTLELIKKKCINCKKCFDVCPRRVFVINNQKIHIADKDKCIECGACVINCPVGALSVDKGVGCASAILGDGSCGCVDGCC
ncbi:MAG: 4Fe-4S binding protein [Candidatus Muirbacterium halophilum]|nr:4Fe-4S binding protein [Candidatus Muirbacterium halophilum]MCK9474312.1 4Fe-4S binding protein [Candidatus Muirbacterium halophilum]